MTGRVATTGLTLGTVAAAPFFRDRRRFGSFCRSNQTRSVSSEIVTPIFASDCAISRIDAPARRSVISTSRYGANAANRWERGLRPSAISRARASACPVDGSVAASAGDMEAVGVGTAPSGNAPGAVASLRSDPSGTGVVSVGTIPGVSGASESCSPADAGPSVVCMPVKYRESVGRATGAPRSESKPKGLDVGVFPSGFLWILPRSCGHQRLLLLAMRFDLRSAIFFQERFDSRCRHVEDSDRSSCRHVRHQRAWFNVRGGPW